MRAVLGVYFRRLPQSDRVVFVSALKPCGAEEKGHTLVIGLFFFSFLFFALVFFSILFIYPFLGIWYLHWRFCGLFPFFFSPFKSIFRRRLVLCLRTLQLCTLSYV